MHAGDNSQNHFSFFRLKGSAVAALVQLLPLITIKVADGLHFQTFISVEKVNSLNNLRVVQE